MNVSSLEVCPGEADRGTRSCQVVPATACKSKKAQVRRHVVNQASPSWLLVSNRLLTRAARNSGHVTCLLLRQSQKFPAGRIGEIMRRAPTTSASCARAFGRPLAASSSSGSDRQTRCSSCACAHPAIPPSLVPPRRRSFAVRC